MTDDRPRIDITKVSDELTRKELLRRAGLGAIVLVYGGTGVKKAVAGVPQFRHKELKETLRIAQWSHFVPAYDVWFDNVYVKRWGQANDTEVLVDHINQADIPARAAAEVAAQSGHDLFWFLAPPAQYEDQVINQADVVGRGPQGGAEAARDRTSDRDRDVAGDRLQHGADLPDDVPRRLHPVQGPARDHQLEGHARGPEVRRRALLARDVERDLRVERVLEQPGISRRPAVAGAERDLDRPQRGTPGCRAGAEHRAGPDPGRAARTVRTRARDGVLRDLEVREEQEDGEEVPRRPRGEVHRGLREQPLLQLPVLPELRLEPSTPSRARPAHADRQVQDPRDDQQEVHVQRRLCRLLERRDRRGVQQVADPADVRAGRAGQDDAQRGRGSGAAGHRHDLRRLAETQEDLGVVRIGARNRSGAACRAAPRRFVRAAVVARLG